MSGNRIVGVVALAMTAIVVVFGISGYLIFTRAASEPLQRVDAIIVLGGEHDGREAYGVELAREGYAPVVVLSNPYGDDDTVMRQMCTGRKLSVEVICKRPDPLTTRGEAIITEQLAAQRNWSSVIVVTWRYHLPRAQYVFNRCLNNPRLNVVMRAVPRDYDMSPLGWAEVYLYQYGGFIKAFAQGSCST